MTVAHMDYAALAAELYGSPWFCMERTEPSPFIAGAAQGLPALVLP